MNLDVFSQYESNVRYYCRDFPCLFSSAKGTRLTDTAGRSYLDFLSGAGTLNYGHNNPAIISAIIDYISRDGIIHSLDMHTEAKGTFIEVFQEIILKPRRLDYKMQFPAPTGTNAIEAALKLARKITGRTNVVAFTNGFHGMTLGALAATANPSKRMGAGLPLCGITFMPFDGYLGKTVDTFDVIELMLNKLGSGIDKPAAILLELVQGEGGLNVARPEWVRKLVRLARDIGALFIVDDIQAGNGRAGSFFSFEEIGITPDIVVLSKSLSGFGTPFALVLMRPELDIWNPGEHNGTFRGNNLAFVGAAAAIEQYWPNPDFEKDIKRKSELMRKRLEKIASLAGDMQVKGRGLFLGIEFPDANTASAIAGNLFDHGIIIETCGPAGQVLKLLPPLTIETAELEDAFDIIETTIVGQIYDVTGPRLQFAN